MTPVIKNWPSIELRGRSFRYSVHACLTFSAVCRLILLAVVRMRQQGIVRLGDLRDCPRLSKSEGNSGMAGTGQEKRVKKMEIHDIFSGGNFVHKV